MASPWGPSSQGWGKGSGIRWDCVAPFPAVISHVAVTLNKMGHNFPKTQTLPAAGSAPGGRGRHGGGGVPPSTTDSLLPLLSPLPLAWLPVGPRAVRPPPPPTDGGVAPVEAGVQGSSGEAGQASRSRRVSRNPNTRPTLISWAVPHCGSRPQVTLPPAPLPGRPALAAPTHCPHWRPRSAFSQPLLALTGRKPQDESHGHGTPAKPPPLRLRAASYRGHAPSRFLPGTQPLPLLRQPFVPGWPVWHPLLAP